MVMTFLRKIEKNRTGRGILVYVKSEYKATVIEK